MPPMRWSHFSHSLTSWVSVIGKPTGSVPKWKPTVERRAEDGTWDFCTPPGFLSPGGLWDSSAYEGADSEGPWSSVDMIKKPI